MSMIMSKSLIVNMIVSSYELKYELECEFDLQKLINLQNLIF